MAMRPDRIVFSPTKTQLHKLRAWLKQEYKQTGEGFICNWDVIDTCWREKTLFCAQTKGEASALCAWHQVGFLARLDIVTVNPELRRAGIGRWLVEETLKQLEKKGLIVVEVECQPRTSEPFWRNLGFSDDFVDVRKKAELAYHKIELTKKLIRTRPTSVNDDCDDGVLQLWDAVPRDVNGPSVWRQWNLGAPIQRSWTLPEPILHACERNWRAKLTLNKETLFDGEVRYLQDSVRIIQDGYLYIRSINRDDIRVYG